MIKIGQEMPKFNLPRDGGQNLESSSLLGSNVILFFYPRDNTPGCTIEAVEFSQYLSEFKSTNTLVFGISKDDIKSHEKFITSKNLTIPLLSDELDHICESFGVWKEKSMYGKTFMGIERSTFLFDTNGVLCMEWRKVNVKGHVQKVLETVKQL